MTNGTIYNAVTGEMTIDASHELRSYVFTHLLNAADPSEVRKAITATLDGYVGRQFPADAARARRKLDELVPA